MSPHDFIHARLAPRAVRTAMNGFPACRQAAQFVVATVPHLACVNANHRYCGPRTSKQSPGPVETVDGPRPL